MSNETNWVSRYLESIEDMEGSQFDRSLSEIADRIMAHKALLIEFSTLVVKLKDVEKALWESIEK